MAGLPENVCSITRPIGPFKEHLFHFVYTIDDNFSVDDRDFTSLERVYEPPKEFSRLEIWGEDDCLTILRVGEREKHQIISSNKLNRIFQDTVKLSDNTPYI